MNLLVIVLMKNSIDFPSLQTIWTKLTNVFFSNSLFNNNYLELEQLLHLKWSYTLSNTVIELQV